MNASSVLIVDDEADALQSLVRALKASGLEHPIHGAGSAGKALEVVQSSRPAVYVLDLSLDSRRGVESGFELLEAITRTDPTARCIVLTGHGGIDHGVRALQLGAAHFLEKPADVLHLSALIRDGISQCELRREHQKLKTERSIATASNLVLGESEAAASIRRSIEYASQTNQPVLICGETGTGKGVCALAIHQSSLRGNRNFVRYQPNFATADLVNSELFGHVKGAFTGASDDRDGLLRQADGGTLFLDEIEALPLETQVSLLGVLQEKRFRPVGGSREIRSDFRLICASNSDIEDDLKKGKLRQDFFHRVAHFRITLPPLRERRSDIPLLVDHALGLLRAQERLSVFSVDESAHARLVSYSWPGNIRELFAVIEGGAYRAQFEGRSSIRAEDLSMPGTSAEQATETGDGFHAQVEHYKRSLIEEALAAHGGNQVHAARHLKMDRSSMRRILERIPDHES